MSVTQYRPGGVGIFLHTPVNFTTVPWGCLCSEARREAVAFVKLWNAMTRYGDHTHQYTCLLEKHDAEYGCVLYHS